MAYQYPSIELLAPAEPGQQEEMKQNTEIICREFGDFRIKIAIEPLNPEEYHAKQPALREEMKQNSEAIRQTFADFRINVDPGPITRGPTFTRYEFFPPNGVRMARFIELSANIAAVLKAVSINILAPIPGKNSIGIEVPNKDKVPVVMRELLESQEWGKTKARLPIALGKNLYSRPVITDLAKAPHLLVAGRPGTGKAVCINTIIASLLYKFSPEELRFIMVDPKQVELQQYNNLPHMIIPVVTDPKKAVLALQWLVNEMEKRYKLFAKIGVRNIEGYNKQVDKLPRSASLTEEIPDKLPYIILIIDELNDLMLLAGKEVETHIMCITQLARAAGIHCIIATQCPSVNVITGVIKANIPARIGFKVSSRTDSNTILDCSGAEKLLGDGDMLFLAPGASRPVRIQGAYISDDEINSILDHIKTQTQPSFSEDLMKKLEQPSNEMGNEDDGEDEELIQKCIDMIYSQNRASTSMLQRAFRLGYNRAARIMDILERRGIVGPSRGGGNRDIIL